MYFGKQYCQGIQSLALLLPEPLGISIRPNMDLPEKQGILPPQRPGTGTLLWAVSPTLNPEFEWSEQPPPLP